MLVMALWRLQEPVETPSAQTASKGHFLATPALSIHGWYIIVHLGLGHGGVPQLLARGDQQSGSQQSGGQSNIGDVPHEWRGWWWWPPIRILAPSRQPQHSLTDQRRRWWRRRARCQRGRAGTASKIIAKVGIVPLQLISFFFLFSFASSADYVLILKRERERERMSERIRLSIIIGTINTWNWLRPCRLKWSVVERAKEACPTFCCQSHQFHNMIFIWWTIIYMITPWTCATSLSKFNV